MLFSLIATVLDVTCDMVRAGIPMIQHAAYAACTLP